MAHHSTSPLLQRYTRGWRLAAAVLVLGAAMASLAWFDYTASRNAFLALARGQAASLRDTIATAAAVTHAAAHDAERQTLQHLLDTARVLADLDRRGLLAPGMLDDSPRVTASSASPCWTRTALASTRRASRRRTHHSSITPLPWPAARTRATHRAAGSGARDAPVPPSGSVLSERRWQGASSTVTSAKS
jgi:hypothetical protein